MVKIPFKEMIIFIYMEEYKICFDNYEISNYGNCRRKCINGNYKTVNGSITNKGYKYFQQNRDGKRKNNMFHQLVYKYFIGDVEDGKEIDHIDRNKLNNRLDNLRAVSHTENLQNTERYRNDVTENDKIKRRNLLAKERETKKRRQAGNKQINEKGNGNIHKRKDTKNDRYMAQITWKGIKYSKTFKTKEEANNYINEIKLG